MLLIIHNLPNTTRFNDVKSLIEEKCGLTEIILDNLLSEGQGKKVTVGLADEGDAAILVRKINGIFFGGRQLYVEDVRQKKFAEQPYRPTLPTSANTPESSLNQIQPAMPERVSRPPPSFSSDNMMAQKRMPIPAYEESLMAMQQAPMMAMQMPSMQNMTYSNMPFYMTPVQNSYMSYENMSTVGNTIQQTQFQQNAFVTAYPALPPQNKMDAPGPPSNYQEKTKPVTKWDSGLSNARQTYAGNQQPGSNNNQLRNANRYSEPERSREEWRRNSHERERGNEPQSGRGRKPERTRESDRGGERFDRKYNSSPSGSREFKEKSGRYNRSPSRDRYDKKSRRDYRRDDYERSNRSSRYDRSPPHDRSRSPGGDYRYSPHRRQESPSRQYEQYTTSKRQLPVTANATARTFSSDPNNSTFIKSNAQVFNKPQNFNNYLANENVHQKVEYSAGNDNWGNNFPPPKRSRLNETNAPMQGKSAAKDSPSFATNEFKIKLKNPAGDYKSIVVKNQNWRHQAAAGLTSTILKRELPGKIENFFVVKKTMKQCIMSRFDVILGEKIVSTLGQMISAYRDKFGPQDDADFLKAVLRKVERDNQDNEELTEKFDEDLLEPYEQEKTLNKPVTQQKPAPMQQKPAPLTLPPKLPSSLAKGKQKAQTQNVPKTVKKKRPNPISKKGIALALEQGKLPKYPQGDKQAYKDQKKSARWEYNTEDAYELSPRFRDTLEEELENLLKLCEEACEGPTEKCERNVRGKILGVVLDDFKKVLKLNVSKRILNAANNLMVRINGHPRLPKREPLESFLKSFDVTALKKSDTKPFYIATCGSFEGFDELLKIKNTIIDDSTVVFKNLHIVGPPPKKTTIYKDPITAPDFINNKLCTEADFTEDITGGFEEENEDFFTSDDVICMEEKNEVINVDENEYVNKDTTGDDQNNHETIQDNDQTADAHLKTEGMTNVEENISQDKSEKDDVVELNDGQSLETNEEIQQNKEDYHEIKQSEEDDIQQSGPQLVATTVEQIDLTDDENKKMNEVVEINDNDSQQKTAGQIDLTQDIDLDAVDDAEIEDDDLEDF